MATRTTCSLNLAEEVLSTGVVVLTGGVDMARTPIITFPEAAHERLITWSAERLLGVLRHYLQWVTCMQKASKFCLLANLQQASRATISVIVEAAEKLELQSRGTIAAFYCMKPYAKSRSRQLKKLLGLKPSKKHPKIPLFKVVLLKTHQDLFSQIDVSELTPEFGGTLLYDHAAWVRFHQTVTPCIREAENAIRRLPDVRDRVELLQEYEMSGQSAADIQNLMAELSDKYHLTVSEAHFQVTLDGCKQTLLLLDHDANTHADWLSQVHADHVTQATSSVRQLFQQLDSQRWQLEETWRGIEDSLTVLLQIQKHRERAVEIEKKIKTHFEPLLREHPCVANTLSQAELYRTHFTTSLYEPAKELLGQATEILEDIQRLKARSSRPACDVSDITQRLTVTLQPFTQHLQGLQDIYVAVHIFHLLLEKALRWYRKVLKFLPDALRERLKEDGGNQILQMPMEWQRSVQSFLHRHPPPQEQHIAKLDTEVPPQVDKRLRLQARSLALRLRLLQRLLFGRRWPVKLLEAAFLWKSELHGNTVGSISSTKETKTPTREHRAQDAAMSQLAPNCGPSIFLPLKRSGSFSSTDTGDLDFFAGQRSSPVTFRLYASSAEEEKSAKEVNPNMAAKKNAGEPLQHPQINLKTIPPTSRISNSNGEHFARDTQDLVNKRRMLRGQTKVLEGVREQERFVRLTFSPSGTTEKKGRSSTYKNNIDSSGGDFLLHDLEGNPTGSESGIEVLDVEDPCDTIVEKIKAVSSSSLPGEVKLQCVSHLLATSSFRQPERRAVTLRDFRRARNTDTSFRSQVVGRPRPKDGRLLSYRAGQDERPRWLGRGHEDPSPLSDDGTGQQYRQKSEAAIKARRPAEPEKLPLGERPASAVAKLRQRLARSLMDLDIADENSIQTGHSTSDEWFSMTSPMKAKRFSYDPAMAHSYQFRQIPSPELRRKSQDDILDFSRPGQGHSAKMTFQGPFGDGSTLLPWLEDGMRPSRRKYFGSHGDLLDFANSSLPKPSPVRLGTQKSPSRWRQNIVVDAPDLPSKGHQQARDFIAPSFLQPSTSLTNTGFNIDTAASSAQSSHSSSDDIHPTVSQLRDRDPEHAKSRRLETFSEQSYNASADSLLIRLSDEAEMEYMSQNELESSLKRSHQILKAAEEKLVRRQQSFDLETGTSQNPEDGSLVNPFDTKDSESSETESSEDSNGPPQILTSQDLDDEGSASQWIHSTFDFMKSEALKGELDWDADVSNMSDHWSEGRKRGQSLSGPDFF